MAVVDGVGPDAQVVVNEKGGKQSDSPYRADLIPPVAALEVAKVTKHGAKYGEWNWHKIPAKDHLNHAMVHILAFQAGDDSEGEVIEHARHAACRILFWLEMLVLEAREAEKAKAVVESWVENFTGLTGYNLTAGKPHTGSECLRLTVQAQSQADGCPGDVD